MGFAAPKVKREHDVEPPMPKKVASVGVITLR